jgi:hypothetical protein
MKSASILPLAIMLATTSMFGQSFTLPPRIDPSKCPVGLQVERSSGLFAYENAKPVPAEHVAPRTEQWFDFRMTNFLPHEIVNAQITAHGFGYKWRVIPVSAATPDIWKTVDVALDVKGNSSASRELSFGHFSTISTIDVHGFDQSVAHRRQEQRQKRELGYKLQEEFGRFHVSRFHDL